MGQWDDGTEIRNPAGEETGGAGCQGDRRRHPAIFSGGEDPHRLRGEDNIPELCRREGIVQNPYYRWSQECKKRLAADTAGAATSDEIKGD